ncbi:hypothetical protein AGMMS50229_00120 [Campylobacterota bacterium]|nr:hypothetical protein AGMMS50229_00120 [Campylobacterota bacterium]
MAMRLLISLSLSERVLKDYKDSRGAFKRTAAKRFEDFDDSAAVAITKRFSANKPLRIADTGVSDGRTALDFFDRLKDAYPAISYAASDYGSRVTCVRKGSLQVCADNSGAVAEIVWKKFVLKQFGFIGFLFYPINFFLYLLLKPIAKRLLQNGTDRREILLFFGAALQTAQNDRRFTLGEHNILEPFDAQFHIVRAMNPLNTSYFTTEQFGAILRHIHNALLPNGLLITGSNQDAGSVVNGGIYQKTAQGFAEVWRSGEGSPITDLIGAFAQDS